VVGVNNSWVSGRAAHSVERVARANLIGIHTVSSTRHVAPPGAVKPVLGTNPIAFGFPTSGEPVVIDNGDLGVHVDRHDLSRAARRAPAEDFSSDMSALVARIKATPRAPGVADIRIPSERAFRERARNRVAGVEIDRTIHDQLVALAG
jgi:LDH2 family malate/lactate/ureidoglycolate dehydrogenase